jgi:hypothetical protein
MSWLKLQKVSGGNEEEIPLNSPVGDGTHIGIVEES